MLPALVAGQTRLSIEEIEPTPLFPNVEPGQPLRQRAMVHLMNAGGALAATVRVTVGNSAAYETELGTIAGGKSSLPIQISDIAEPARLIVEVLRKDDGRSLAKQERTWQPQKKWRIFCVSYCHQDLGYGDYPHRLRTSIRHANIERPLKFCTETDGWDDDSKYRYMIETSEPITSFLGSHSEADAMELSRRIREGRIQIGALHNTASTEHLTPELMARLFYLTGRHARDLLDVPASRTAQIDDVIGLTW
jgi:hypothetical protein